MTQLQFTPIFTPKNRIYIILLPLIIIITAPPRVERSLNLFYSSSRSIYIYIYMYSRDELVVYLFFSPYIYIYIYIYMHI